jgi:hypothetical protein
MDSPDADKLRQETEFRLSRSGLQRESILDQFRDSLSPGRSPTKREDPFQIVSPEQKPHAGKDLPRQIH